jgi:hypothetical protein
VDSVLISFFHPAENTQCEKSFIKNSNGVESEKENENGEESFKSPPKIHRSSLSMTVEETEKELIYRRKYFKGKL